MKNKTFPDSQIFWYILFTLGVIVLALAGYIGYVLYPRFELPAASGIGLLILAAAASIASFFSPCSFPLLVGLLARETSSKNEEDSSALWWSLRFGAALAVGASLFLLLLGIGIAVGGGSLFRGITFTSTVGRIIRFVVGILLIVLGLIQVDLIPLPFKGAEGLGRTILEAQARIRQTNPTLGFAILGFGYLLAGFG